MICIDCTCVLEEDETGRYRCVACETVWLERVDQWRAGAEDPELDGLFSRPSPAGRVDRF